MANYDIGNIGVITVPGTTVTTTIGTFPTYTIVNSTHDMASNRLIEHLNYPGRPDTGAVYPRTLKTRQ
tara:strand:- start:403 stop:606 length:204 start_codon:yes stop_codon:yes gene_type:complete